MPPPLPPPPPLEARKRIRNDSAGGGEGTEGWGVSLELIGTIMQIRSRVYGILETKMMGFVMGVIGKWSKVVIFAPEPAFYYLSLVSVQRDCNLENKRRKLRWDEF